MFTLKTQSPLMAVVIMLGTKEKVWCCYYRVTKSTQGGGRGGWTTRHQTLTQFPVSNQQSTLFSFNHKHLLPTHLHIQQLQSNTSMATNLVIFVCEFIIIRDPFHISSHVIIVNLRILIKVALTKRYSVTWKND